MILVAALLALVEIQMEGKYGYAQKLPVSWRAANKWVKLFVTGTSYHLYMGLFLLAIIHVGFVAGLAWTLKTELLVLSFLAFITVAEDFLWFVLNPHYGIKKMKRSEIPWFQNRWLLFCPNWYYWYLPVGVGLYIWAQI